MCQYQAVDGVATDWHHVHYSSFARGGAGLVMVEATAVVPEGRISPACLGLWDDAHTRAFEPIVRSVHGVGGKIGIQLAHAGRKASTYPHLPGFDDTSVPISEGGWETVGPTAEAFPGLAAPRALDSADIEGVIDAFVRAADRAVEAGFDLIELHGAHGYLFSSFLSQLVNTREDAYGGSLAHRAQPLRETVRRIRGHHPLLPVTVRISASDWLDEGFTPEDGAELARMLADDGADLIDVSSAANVPSSPITVGPAYQTPFAGIVREGGLPVGAVGMIVNGEQAETILVTGLADVVFIGRAALKNPMLPVQWAHDLRWDDATELVSPSYARAWPKRRR